MLSFVVPLVFTDDSGQHTIARYDTAHGTAHRDLVSPRDRLFEKRWLIDFGLSGGLGLCCPRLQNELCPLP
jgi:hypothetical protein